MIKNQQLTEIFKSYITGHFYQLQEEDEYRYTHLWRPKFIVGYRLKSLTLSERFQKWNHARDEARTLARRIVRLCRQKEVSYTFILKHGSFKDPSSLISKLDSIKGKHPKGVVETVHKSIIQFEAEFAGRDIRHTCSIRPVIDKDRKGYLVQSVNFIDGKDGKNLYYSI